MMLSRYLIFFLTTQIAWAQDFSDLVKTYKTMTDQYQEIATKLESYRNSPEYQQFLRSEQNLGQTEPMQFTFVQSIGTIDKSILECDGCPPEFELVGQINQILQKDPSIQNNANSLYESNRLLALYSLGLNNPLRENLCGAELLETLEFTNENREVQNLRFSTKESQSLDRVNGFLLENGANKTYLFLGQDSEGKIKLIKLVQNEDKTTFTFYQLKNLGPLPSSIPSGITTPTSSIFGVKANYKNQSSDQESFVANFGVWSDKQPALGESIEINILRTDLENNIYAENKTTLISSKISTSEVSVSSQQESARDLSKMTISSNFSSIQVNQRYSFFVDQQGQNELTFDGEIAAPFIDPLKNISTKLTLNFSLDKDQTVLSSNVSFLNTGFNDLSISLKQQINNDLKLGLGGNFSSSKKIIFVETTFTP